MSYFFNFFFLMNNRETALEFDPDRFLDERLHKYLIPNPFIFLPFNAGPRICLGQQVRNPFIHPSTTKGEGNLTFYFGIKKKTVCIQRIFLFPSPTFTKIFICITFGRSSTTPVSCSYRVEVRGRSERERKD